MSFIYGPFSLIGKKKGIRENMEERNDLPLVPQCNLHYHHPLQEGLQFCSAEVQHLGEVLHILGTPTQYRAHQ